MASNTRRRIEQRVKQAGAGARTSALSARRRVRSLAADAFALGARAPAFAMEKLGAAARGALGATGRRTARKVARQAKRAVKASDARSYEERTRGELYELAQERDLEGRSGMSKKQLIAALRR